MGLGDPDEVTLFNVLCMARRNYIYNIKTAMDVTRRRFMVGFADSQVLILGPLAANAPKYLSIYKSPEVLNRSVQNVVQGCP